MTARGEGDEHRGTESAVDNSVRLGPVPRALVAFLVAAVGVEVMGAGPATAWVDTRLCSKGDYAPGPNPVYPLQDLLAVNAPVTKTSTGREVTRSVQEALWMGYYPNPEGDPIVVDGDYGPQTAFAVRAFQRRHGLVVDGTVGPQSWKALGRATCEGSTRSWSKMQGRSSNGEQVIVLRNKRRLTIVWWEAAAYAVREPGSTTKYRGQFGGEGFGGRATFSILPTAQGFRFVVRSKSTGKGMPPFTTRYRKVPYTGKLL